MSIRSRITRILGFAPDPNEMIHFPNYSFRPGDVVMIRELSPLSWDGKVNIGPRTAVIFNTGASVEIKAPIKQVRRFLFGRVGLTPVTH